jgi:hypothetical protein
MRKSLASALLIGLAGLSLFELGCSSAPESPTASMHKMGEKVHVGPLVYGVYEAEWVPQLGQPPQQRIPKHRFLVLKVSLSNAGESSITVPGVALENAKGEVYPELTEGDGLKDWLPILRRLGPSEMREGQILFDAPPGAYQLVVKEEMDFDKDPAHERVAKIEIPLSLSSPGSLRAQ